MWKSEGEKEENTEKHLLRIRKYKFINPRGVLDALMEHAQLRLKMKENKFHSHFHKKLIFRKDFAYVRVWEG